MFGLQEAGPLGRLQNLGEAEDFDTCCKSVSTGEVLDA